MLSTACRLRPRAHREFVGPKSAQRRLLLVPTHSHQVGSYALSPPLTCHGGCCPSWAFGAAETAPTQVTGHICVTPYLAVLCWGEGCRGAWCAEWVHTTHACTLSAPSGRLLATMLSPQQRGVSRSCGGRASRQCATAWHAGRARVLPAADVVPQLRLSAAGHCCQGVPRGAPAGSTLAGSSEAVSTAASAAAAAAAVPLGVGRHRRSLRAGSSSVRAAAAPAAAAAAEACALPKAERLVMDVAGQQVCWAHAHTQHACGMHEAGALNARGQGCSCVCRPCSSASCVAGCRHLLLPPPRPSDRPRDGRDWAAGQRRSHGLHGRHGECVCTGCTCTPACSARATARRWHRCRGCCSASWRLRARLLPLLLLLRRTQVLYATACCGNSPQGDGSFLPLSVHYQERFSAAGRTRCVFVCVCVCVCARVCSLCLGGVGALPAAAAAAA
jgi:hypothetical protein